MISFERCCVKWNWETKFVFNKAYRLSETSTGLQPEFSALFPDTTYEIIGVHVVGLTGQNETLHGKTIVVARDVT